MVKWKTKKLFLQRKVFSLMKPVGLNNIHARTSENLQLLVPVCALADTIAYALITVIS